MNYAQSLRTLLLSIIAGLLLLGQVAGVAAKDAAPAAQERVAVPVKTLPWLVRSDCVLGWIPSSVIWCRSSL